MRLLWLKAMLPQCNHMLHQLRMRLLWLKAMLPQCNPTPLQPPTQLLWLKAMRLQCNLTLLQPLTQLLWHRATLPPCNRMPHQLPMQLQLPMGEPMELLWALVPQPLVALVLEEFYETVSQARAHHHERGMPPSIQSVFW